ncbi:unnamed protein product [Caenorhabditis angaria]|uniref:Uncharacterized protein n=1 Tax=Caenorhabditis angaria TaxID=860376 RepID=A0A9P1J104_9PELO|nr:unnamed protein product [Caenorhabditis angaria]
MSNSKCFRFEKVWYIIELDNGKIKEFRPSTEDDVDVLDVVDHVYERLLTTVAQKTVKDGKIDIKNFLYAFMNLSVNQVKNYNSSQFDNYVEKNSAAVTLEKPPKRRYKRNQVQEDPDYEPQTDFPPGTNYWLRKRKKFNYSEDRQGTSAQSDEQIVENRIEENIQLQGEEELGTSEYDQVPEVETLAEWLAEQEIQESSVETGQLQETAETTEDEKNEKSPVHEIEVNLDHQEIEVKREILDDGEEEIAEPFDEDSNESIEENVEAPEINVKLENPEIEEVDEADMSANIGGEGEAVGVLAHDFNHLVVETLEQNTLDPAACLRSNPFHIANILFPPKFSQDERSHQNDAEQIDVPSTSTSFSEKLIKQNESTCSQVFNPEIPPTTSAQEQITPDPQLPLLLPELPQNFFEPPQVHSQMPQLPVMDSTQFVLTLLRTMSPGVRALLSQPLNLELLRYGPSGELLIPQIDVGQIHNNQPNQQDNQGENGN